MNAKLNRSKEDKYLLVLLLCIWIVEFIYMKKTKIFLKEKNAKIWK